MNTNIPNYLSASTPELLRELMLEKNISSGLDILFFDITYDGKNWVCWFYEAVDTMKILTTKIKTK